MINAGVMIFDASFDHKSRGSQTRLPLISAPAAVPPDVRKASGLPRFGKLLFEAAPRAFAEAQPL